jgi:hypothetical protein
MKKEYTKLVQKIFQKTKEYYKEGFNKFCGIWFIR